MRRKALNPTAPARSGPTASAREDRRVLASLEATGPARAAQGQTAQAWPTHSALAKLRPSSDRTYAAPSAGKRR